MASLARIGLKRAAGRPSLSHLFFEMGVQPAATATLGYCANISVTSVSLVLNSAELKAPVGHDGQGDFYNVTERFLSPLLSSLRRS